MIVEILEHPAKDEYDIVVSPEGIVRVVIPVQFLKHPSPSFWSVDGNEMEVIFSFPEKRKFGIFLTELPIIRAMEELDLRLENGDDDSL